MNKVFKSVWNQATGAWVAVSEAASGVSGRGVSSVRSLVRSQSKKNSCVRQAFSLAGNSGRYAPGVSSLTLAKVACFTAVVFSLGTTTLARAQSPWQVSDATDFSTALQNAGNGDTVQLLADIDIIGNWTAPSANTLIFDLGSHKLSGAVLQFLAGGSNFTFDDGSSSGKVSGNSVAIGNAANAVAIKLTGTTNIAATGNFSVTGSGSTLDLQDSSSADVGGMLTVSSGGKLTLDGTTVDNKLTAGAIAVTGAGSALNLQDSSSADVAGALTVSSGGKLTLDGAAVGNKLTAGAITVTGADSALDLQGLSSADVAGALTVSSGGKLTLDGTANVDGDVTVSGVQNNSGTFYRSTLQGNGTLDLTGGGAQTLTVNSGALVSLASDSLMLASNKKLMVSGLYSLDTTTFQTEVVLNDLTAQGEVSVAGGAKLSVGNLLVENGSHAFKVDGVAENVDSNTLYHSELAIAGNMDIGTTNAKGTLEVSNGAKASVAGDVAVGNTNDGELTVSGIDKNTNEAALLDIDGGLIVGNTGKGVLTLKEGAHINVAQDVILGKDSDARVTLTGVPSAPQTQLTTIGDLTIAEGADAELTIKNGALFSANAGTVGKNAGTTGTIKLYGYGGASVTEQARLQTGNTTLGESGNAIVDIQSGGLLSTGSTILAKQAGSSATVTINAMRSNFNYAWTIGGGNTDPGYTQGEASLNVTNGWVNVAGFLSMGTQGDTANATFTGSGAELNMVGGTFRNEGSTDGSTGNQKGVTLIKDNAYVSGSGQAIAGDHFEVNHGVVAPGSRWMYDFDRADSGPGTNALASLGHLTIESRNASKTTVFTHTTFQTELDRGDTSLANLNGLSDQVTVNGNLQLDDDFKIDMSRVLDGRYLLVNTTGGGMISGYTSKDLMTAGDFDINLNGKTLKGNERVDYAPGKVYTSLENGDTEIYLNLESTTQGNVVTHWTGNASSTWDMVSKNFESATTASTEQFLDGDIVVFDDKWMKDNVSLDGTKRQVNVTTDVAKYKSNVMVPEVRVFDEGAAGTIFSWDGGSIHAYDSALYTTLDRGDPNARNQKTPTGSLVKIGSGTLEIKNANQFYGGVHLGGNVHDYDTSYADQWQSGGVIYVKNSLAFGAYDNPILHPYKGMIFVHQDSTLQVDASIQLQNRFYIDPGKTLDIVFDGTFTIQGNNALLDSAVNAGRGGGIFIGDAGKINYIGSGGMVVSSNKANSGGGIYTEIGYSLPVAAKLSGNYASQQGGAVFAENKFELQNGSEISGNAARDEGGGIYIDNKDDNTEAFTLHGNTTVTNNLAGENAKGGGIYVADGRQLIIDTQKNASFEGGDVWFSGNKVGAVFDSDHPDDLSKIDGTNAKANALHLTGSSTLTINGPYNTYFYDPITGDAGAKVVINGVAANASNTTASHSVEEGQTGTVVFQGASDYLGSTAVNAGATFRVENDAVYGATGSASVFNLDQTASLTGQGTIIAGSIKLDGLVDLDTGSFSQPLSRDGSGAINSTNTQGTLSLAGVVSVADTANWKLNLTNSGSPRSDLIAVTGAASFTGTTAGNKLKIDTDGVVRGKYKIMSATGNISGYNTDLRKSDATVYTNDPGALAGIDLSTSQLTSASNVNLGRLKATSYVDTAAKALYLDIIGRNRHITASSGGAWTYDNSWRFGGADEVTPTGANTGGTVGWGENDAGPATNAYLDGDMVTLTGGDYSLNTAVKPVDLYVTTGNVSIAGNGGITTFSTSATSGTTITTNTADNDYGIAGYTGKLYKYDSGTLAFSNTVANTFTGGIVVGQTAQDGGTIKFSNGNQLGVGAGAFMLFNGSGVLKPTATTTLATAIQIANGKTVTVETGSGISLTVSGKIADKTLETSGKLEKTGDGTLILTGANTYTGGTTLQAGQITIGNNQALGTYTGVGKAGVAEMLANGTVIATDATNRVITNRIEVANGLSGSGATVTTGGGDLTMNGPAGSSMIHVGNGSNLNLGGAQNIFINGGVTGTSGTLNKTSTGIVQINANSDFSGTTNVNAGTLRVTDGNTFGSGSAGTKVAVDTDAILAGGGTVKAETITVNGTLSADKAVLSSGNTTINALDPNRFGTLTLDGKVTLDGFTLAYNADTAGVAAIDPAEAASWSGDLLELAGSSASLKSGTIDLQGTISSGKYLLIDSQQTITLEQGKVLDGLNFANGVLGVNYGGNVLETNNGPRGSYSIAFANNSANVSEAQVWLDINRNTLTMDWAATGGNKLWGDNHWVSQQESSTFNHASQFNNGDYVNFENNSGVAETITVASNVMTSGFTVAGSNDFTFDGAGGIRVAGQIETGIEGIYLNGTGGLPIGAPTITVDGKLQKTGAGTLTFANAGSNKFEGGIFISEGTLAFTRADQLGTTNLAGTVDHGINFIDNATLQAKDDVAALGNNINITNSKTATLDVVNDKTLNISGRIDEIGNTGSASIDKIGDGRLMLSGTHNDYAGATKVSAGTLAITNAGAVGGTSGVNVDSNANFALDYVADGTFGKLISGAGNVLKEGSAKVTLTGSHTYSGRTTVSGGTLVINNAGAVGGTSGVTIDNGAAFELAYTADGSFAKYIDGGGKLVKTGAATVTIDRAANDYSGGTDVADGKLILQNVGSAGTGTVNVNNTASLQLDGAGTFANALEGAGNLTVNNDVRIERDNDQHTGSITINNGNTLTFDHAADVAMSNDFSGGGDFAKEGIETLKLSGVTGWTGDTFLNQGNLTLDGSQGGAQLTSNLTSAASTEFRVENNAAFTGAINAGGSALSDVFIGTGVADSARWTMTDSSNVNNLALNGNLHFSPQGSFKTLNVANSLSGTGHLYMNTNLGAQQGDKIVTNETSGNHVIHVTNRGGNPSAPGQALEIVEITDQSKSLGNFSLKGGKVDAGAYRYTLMQGSALPVAMGAQANNWFLYNSGMFSDLNKQVQNGANSVKYATIASLNSLHKRLGELRENEHEQGNVWMRAYGKEYEYNMFQDQDTKQNVYGFEIGSDRLFRIDSGRVYLGGMVGSGRSDVDSHQQGSIDSKNVQAGAYATWMFDSGTYVDLVGRYFWFNHDYVFGSDDSRDKADNRSTAFSADIEVGHKLMLSDGWFVGPQAELTWVRGGSHDLTTDTGTHITFDRSNTLIGRAGLALGKEMKSENRYSHLYGRIDRLQNISESNDVIINGDRFSPSKENGSWVGTVGMQLTHKTSNFYVELETGLGNADVKQKWGINAGARWSF